MDTRIKSRYFLTTLGGCPQKTDLCSGQGEWWRHARRGKGRLAGCSGLVAAWIGKGESRKRTAGVWEFPGKLNFVRGLPRSGGESPKMDNLSIVTLGCVRENALARAALPMGDRHSPLHFTHNHSLPPHINPPTTMARPPLPPPLAAPDSHRLSHFLDALFEGQPWASSPSSTRRLVSR